MMAILFNPQCVNVLGLTRIHSIPAWSKKHKHGVILPTSCYFRLCYPPGATYFRPQNIVAVIDAWKIQVAKEWEILQKSRKIYTV